MLLLQLVPVPAAIKPQRLTPAANPRNACPNIREI